MQNITSVENITATLTQFLEVVYNTTEPNARKEAIANVENLQQCDKNGIDPRQLAAAALAVMQNPDVCMSTRAYGAVILRSLMTNFGLGGEDSHFADIAQWISGADDTDNCFGGRLACPIAITKGLAGSSIHRVVAGSCSLLIGTAASLTWPQHCPNLIPLLCGEDGLSLANRRGCQRVLLEVCRSCCEPNYATLPKKRISELRSAVRAASPSIVRAAVSALERQYVYLSQVFAAPSAWGSESDAVQCVTEDMSCCIEVLSLAAKTCDPMLDTLWAANVDHALRALIALGGSLGPANNRTDAVSTAMSRVPLLALDACVAIIGNISRDAVLLKQQSESVVEKQRYTELIQRLVQFIVSVLSSTNGFIDTCEFEAVLRLVEITSRSSSLKHITAAAAAIGHEAPLSAAVFAASVAALRVPNVAMATDICEAISDRLQSIVEQFLSGQRQEAANVETLLNGFEPDRCLLQLMRFAVRDHYNAWTPFIPRHSEDDTIYQREGRRISEVMCDNLDTFMAIYSQLRSAMGPLCASIAALYPSVGQQFIIHLLSRLAAPTHSDPKSATGNVRQVSATYATWEAAEFLIGSMAAPCAFSIVAASNYVEEWLASCMSACKTLYVAIFASPNSDATLAPVFLNILQSLWAVCLPSAEFMFNGIPKRIQKAMAYNQVLSSQAVRQTAADAVTYLFDFMKKVPSQGHILSDPDVVSQRKRAMTLLIRFGPSFAAGMCSFDASIGQLVVSQIKAEAEKSLIADKVLPTERSLLNEALAGLTSMMNSKDAEASTRALLGPSVEALRAFGSTMSSQSFAALLCDDSRQAASQRDTLRDSVSTITAVLRRSAVNAFSSEVARSVIPLLGNLTIIAHSLKPANLKEGYAGILDPTDDEQKQAMINGSGVRRPPDLTNRVSNTRRYFASLRIALYQGIALLPRFMPVDNFTEGISQVLIGVEGFSTPTMRDLCEQCLYPVTAECPALITITLRSLQSFLRSRSQMVVTEKQHIVDTKQLHYFSRDAITYIRATLIEGKKFQDVVKGPPLEGPSYQSNAMALVASSSASFPFLSDIAALELLTSSICALLTWGHDVRSASYLAIVAINEMRRKDVNGTSFGEACLTLFAVVAGSVVLNPSVDRQSTREYILSMLSDLYVEHFPFFAPSLVLTNDPVSRMLRGIRNSIASTELIERLHSQLMTVKGPRQKRQCFVDFVLKCLSVSI